MRLPFTLLIVLTWVTVVAATVQAQERAASWFSPRLGEARPDARYRLDASFDASVGRQSADMRMFEHDFQLSVPIEQDQRREWTLQTGVAAIDIDSSARLPDSFDRFPNELWDVHVGTTYRTRLDNDWIAGGQLSVGSPSDRPFASGDEILVSAHAFVRVPTGERDAWLFSLSYANRRAYLSNVPIPGVAYHYRPNDDLDIVAGVPTTVVQWRPTEKLSLEASYWIPRSVHVQLAYHPVATLKLYSGFDWSNRWFLRHDRRHDDRRLSYYEKRVVLGARWEPRDDFWIDLAGGWAFDRFWFEGEDYGDRGDNRLDLSDGPIVMVQVGVGL